MDLALNNLQRLIRHKTNKPKQTIKTITYLTATTNYQYLFHTIGFVDDATSLVRYLKLTPSPFYTAITITQRVPQTDYKVTADGSNYNGKKKIKFKNWFKKRVFD